MHARSTGRALTIVAVAALGLTGAGCAAKPAAQRRPPAQRSPGALPCASPRSASSICGLVPAHSGLSSEIHLARTRAIAGTDVRATITVVNRNPYPIDLFAPGPKHAPFRCRPKFGLALTSRHGLYGGGFSFECDIHPLVLRPGANRFPTVVGTTYTECSEQGAPSPNAPMCIGPQNNVMPALPPGKYLVVLAGLGAAVPFAQPVPLTVTRAP